jgi:hypothetical protein
MFGASKAATGKKRKRQGNRAEAYWARHPRQRRIAQVTLGAGAAAPIVAYSLSRHDAAVHRAKMGNYRARQQRYAEGLRTYAQRIDDLQKQVRAWEKRKHDAEKGLRYERWRFRNLYGEDLM